MEEIPSTETTNDRQSMNHVDSPGRNSATGFSEVTSNDVPPLGLNFRMMQDVVPTPTMDFDNYVQNYQDMQTHQQPINLTTNSANLSWRIFIHVLLFT